MDRFSFVSCFFFLLASSLCFSNINASCLNGRPNIILFFVDDVGWNDVGFHGMTEIPTPNIDALAYNGIILNNYYTHPTCSPSRSALLSGIYATRFGLQHQVILHAQNVGLPLHLTTLPQFLNFQGYESHVVGKWHLGFASNAYTPLRRGFKSHYGFWTGFSDHFYHTSDYVFNRTDLYGIPCYEPRDSFMLSGLNFRDGYKTVNKPGEYLTYLYTERATKIIDNHRQDKPLFLYLSHHGVHRGNVYLPIRAPKPLVDLFTNIRNDSSRQNFAGALTAIDRSVGDVMEALERNGMLNNTIFIFSTDNGAPFPTGFGSNGGSNYPLRGSKMSGWEGGTRGTAFIWSSMFQRKGSVYDGMMHIVDWLPTLYAAAGGVRDIKNNYNLDGINMWDAIRDSKPSPRKNMLLQSDEKIDLVSYRSGDFKIVSGAEASTSGYYGPEGRGPPPQNIPKTSSKTEQVLRRYFGNDVKVTGQPVEVKCGDVSTRNQCEQDKVCLFNIREDPCEYRNIAEDYPEIVTRLQEELGGIQVSKPNFPKSDFASNPIFHNGYWSPWTDTVFDVNSTSC